MPSRVIRAEINSSRSLARVSEGADLLFRALIVVVDDFGRFDARLELLKAACFPTRRISLRKIEARLQELCREGCVACYEVAGKPYLQLTGWEKHRGMGRRAESSKYPELQAPQKSEDFPEIPGNPPVLRLTRDEKREARSESGACAPPQPPAAPQSSDSANALVHEGTSPRPKKARACRMPDPLPRDQTDRLVELARKAGFSRSQCRHATQVVRDWAEGGGHPRADWVRVVLGAMRRGWGLEGFGGNAKPRNPGRPLPGSPELPQEQGTRGQEFSGLGELVKREVAR